MRYLPVFFAGCAALALSACSDVRETFGLTNAPPDEFAVVDHPPLSMPPDYALHPPRPGEASVQAVQPAKQAAQALYGADKMQLVPEKGVSNLPSQNLSPSEQALIASSGSATADPHIRSTLDREATQQVVANRKLIDTLLFWKPPKKAPTPVVDALAEHKRLEEAKKKNLPVTSGGTPIVNQTSTVQ